MQTTRVLDAILNYYFIANKTVLQKDLFSNNYLTNCLLLILVNAWKHGTLTVAGITNRSAAQPSRRAPT